MPVNNKLAAVAIQRFVILADREAEDARLLKSEIITNFCSQFSVDFLTNINSLLRYPIENFSAARDNNTESKISASIDNVTSLRGGKGILYVLGLLMVFQHVSSPAAYDKVKETLIFDHIEKMNKFSSEEILRGLKSIYRSESVPQIVRMSLAEIVKGLDTIATKSVAQVFDTDILRLAIELSDQTRATHEKIAVLLKSFESEFVKSERAYENSQEKSAQTGEIIDIAGFSDSLDVPTVNFPWIVERVSDRDATRNIDIARQYQGFWVGARYSSQVKSINAQESDNSPPKAYLVRTVMIIDQNVPSSSSAFARFRIFYRPRTQTGKFHTYGNIILDNARFLHFVGAEIASSTPLHIVSRYVHPGSPVSTIPGLIMRNHEEGHYFCSKIVFEHCRRALSLNDINEIVGFIDEESFVQDERDGISNKTQLLTQLRNSAPAKGKGGLIL